MKKYLSTLLAALSCYAAAQWALPAPGHALPHQAVSDLKLSEYLGTWYEIASFPMFFQSRDCIGTTATYTRQADGRIKVWNQCHRRRGDSWTLDRVEGSARPTEQPGQLKVTFGGPEADYWVIALDDNYQYALVGHPRRDYLWILSREPIMLPELYAELVQRAQAMGYDVSRLEKTPPRRAFAP